MDKKPDRRILKTKKAIYEAFSTLLKTSSVKQITVSDICELADINRNTFYYHYADVPSLLDEITETFVVQMENIYARTELKPVDRITAICKLFLESRDLVGILNNNAFFFSVIESLEPVASKYLIKDLPKKNQEAGNLISSYVIGGTLATITRWIKTGAKESPEEISLLITSLMSNI